MVVLWWLILFIVCALYPDIVICDPQILPSYSEMMKGLPPQVKQQHCPFQTRAV